MSIVLYHHPHSRAANVVWMLEEVGVPYELEYTDLYAGSQKTPEFLAMNPMGKLPLLKDGELLITEGAAIGLYLADRYAAGRLAPALDDPARGTYFRWALFAPSVVEPAAMSKMSNWDYKPSNAGWGDFESMLRSLEAAVTPGPYLLGDRFSMADVILGGTLGYMLEFKMIEARPAFTEYVGRLTAREASQRAEAKNAAVGQEHGVG
ncbi:MAG: glutathione S-transferase family protein [Polyangiaceae bacterium]|nr:glutathione S-transferase family protein [Polyangiaceae bacterium]MCW5791041.1 glutathione S-transferase family protein [Polyangiaceae bacterium]